MTLVFHEKIAQKEKKHCKRHGFVSEIRFKFSHRQLFLLHRMFSFDEQNMVL